MTLIIELGVVFGLLSIAAMLHGKRNYPENTLVLGSGLKARTLLREIETQSSLANQKVLGFISGKNGEDLVPDSLCIKPEAELQQLITSLQVKTLVIAMEPDEARGWSQQLLDCKLGGVNIVDSSMYKLNPRAKRVPRQEIRKMLTVPVVR